MVDPGVTRTSSVGEDPLTRPWYCRVARAVFAAAGVALNPIAPELLAVHCAAV